MRRLFTLLIGLIAIAAIAAVAAAPASARPRGTNGKILINRADNLVTGEEQTFTVNPDGSDFNLLVNNSEAGQWSHDGTRITVGTEATGSAVLDFDTGVLTSLNLDAQYPDLFLPCGEWSSDDKRLACEGFGITDPSLNGIYTVRSSDGGDLRQVTSAPGGDDIPGDFSPDGNRMVFFRSTLGALFVVNTNGTGLKQITPADFRLSGFGSWSPQGNEIVFSRHVTPDVHSSIWVVHADGTGLRRIPVPDCGGLNADPNGVGCPSPSWSPDGQKIVFSRQVGTQPHDIYTVNADGSGLFNVTNTPDINEFSADWGIHPLTP